MNDRVEIALADSAESGAATDSLRELLAAPVEVRDPAPEPGRITGMVVDTVLAMRGPHEPLVVYPGQPDTASVFPGAASRKAINPAEVSRMTFSASAHCGQKAPPHSMV